jgi:hypothetical protein
VSKLQDKLKAGIVKKSLATSKPVNAVIVRSEIDKTINRIKSNLLQYKEIKVEIVRDLLYLKNHQADLTAEKGMTFQEFIERELGITKGHFYEQLQAYNLCVTYHDENTFNEVDTKILVMISRLEQSEQPKFFKRARELTRADIPKVRRSDSHTRKSKNKDLPGQILMFNDADNPPPPVQPKRYKFDDIHDSVFKKKELLKLYIAGFLGLAQRGSLASYDIKNQDDAKAVLIEFIQNLKI